MDDRRKETPEARRVGIVIDDDILTRKLETLLFLSFFFSMKDWRLDCPVYIERGGGGCSSVLVGKRAVMGRPQLTLLTRPKTTELITWGLIDGMTRIEIVDSKDGNAGSFVDFCTNKVKKTRQQSRQT